MAIPKVFRRTLAPLKGRVTDPPVMPRNHRASVSGVTSREGQCPSRERVKKRLVGADAYIGPFVNVTNSPETANNRCFHCGAMWASPPTTRENRHF